MSVLKFPYRKYPRIDGGYALVASIPINIALPFKNSPRSKRFDAVIDSGAARTTIHSSVGKALGITIMDGQPNDTYGISGEPTKTYLHDIHLYAPGGIIPITAAFTDNLPVSAVLGMIGFFEHFRITFDPTANRCEIERLYQA